MNFTTKWRLLDIKRKAIRSKHKLEHQMKIIGNKYKPKQGQNLTLSFPTSAKAKMVFTNEEPMNIRVKSSTPIPSMPKPLFRRKSPKMYQENKREIDIFDDMQIQLDNLKRKRLERKQKGFKNSLKIDDYFKHKDPKLKKKSVLEISNDLQEIITRRKRTNIVPVQELQKTIQKKYLSGGFE